MAGLLTGVAWYRRSEWPLLASLAADPDVLAKTYDEWLLMAEATYARLQQEGYIVEKVEVPLADLLVWCAAQGRALNESARSAFVADTLRRRDQAQSSPGPSSQAAPEKPPSSPESPLSGPDAPGDAPSDPKTP